jgi:hypothetical protein
VRRGHDRKQETERERVRVNVSVNMLPLSHLLDGEHPPAGHGRWDGVAVHALGLLRVELNEV